jgi:hypothetical protein
MSTLKTTIKLESTTLFPTPINLTKISNEQINGEYGSFQTNVLEPSGMEAIFENDSLLGNSGVLYLYAEAASANAAGYGVDFLIYNKSTDSSSYFARVLPGDILYLPVYAADAQGITVYARNNNPAASSTITYFFGSRD